MSKGPHRGRRVPLPRDTQSIIGRDKAAQPAEFGERPLRHSLVGEVRRHTGEGIAHLLAASRAVSGDGGKTLRCNLGRTERTKPRDARNSSQTTIAQNPTAIPGASRTGNTNGVHNSPSREAKTSFSNAADVSPPRQENPSREDHLIVPGAAARRTPLSAASNSARVKSVSPTTSALSWVIEAASSSKRSAPHLEHRPVTIAM